MEKIKLPNGIVLDPNYAYARFLQGVLDRKKINWTVYAAIENDEPIEYVLVREDGEPEYASPSLDNILGHIDIEVIKRHYAIRN